MPEMIPLGWFHTAMGAIALLSGIFALIRFKEITWAQAAGKIYLLATLVTAVSALGIYQRGTFGPGHVLAVLTLLALGLGTAAAAGRVFGAWSRKVRAASYSATLLFHSIPAITDASLRLPVGDPLLDSIDDPILKGAYGILLLIYLVGVTLQLRWIGRHGG